MGWVGWLIMLSLPLYAIVQVVLLVRIGARVEADDPLPVRGYRFEADPTPDPPDAAGACQRCGTENDPAYRFCRRCVGRVVG